MIGRFAHLHPRHADRHATTHIQDLAGDEAAAVIKKIACCMRNIDWRPHPPHRDSRDDCPRSWCVWRICLIKQGGGNWSRPDGIYGDSVPARLQSPCPGHPEQTGLRGGIGGSVFLPRAAREEILTTRPNAASFMPPWSPYIGLYTIEIIIGLFRLADTMAKKAKESSVTTLQ